MRALHLNDAARFSALWAAYGDALGFISEGVDARGLHRRLGGHEFTTRPWRRKLGYRGPEVELPAGCYSDDTQLRLATSRAIGADGKFDVDAFANIELAIWPVYSLGGGRGSLDAARRISLGENWRDLVRRDKGGKYVNGGGNGGAMRIQPLVWSGLRDESLARAIIENVACTHGHPKAFVGAMFHAFCLVVALEDGQIASDEMSRLGVQFVSRGIDAASSLLGRAWLQDWSKATGENFDEVWVSATDEIASMISRVRGPSNPGEYRNLLQKNGLLEETERGSATKTAAAAFAALMMLREQDPTEIVEVIVTSFGSDTDSIATMAGAVMGAALRLNIDFKIQDRQYILDEATRVSAGKAREPYANVAQLRKPVIIENDRLHCGGLGDGIPISDQFESAAERYRWYRLRFGQTVLVQETHVRVKQVNSVREEPTLFATEPKQSDRTVEVKRNAQSPSRATADESDVSAFARQIADKGFDHAQIGRAITALSRREGGEGLAAVLAFEIVRLARRVNKSSTNFTDTVEPSAESARSKPGPLIQLQMTASFDSEKVNLTGIIANYGREPATNVQIMLNGRDEPLFVYDRLDVKERHDIDVLIDGADIAPHDRVIALFLNGKDRLRQGGTFEATSGRPDVLLFKGLGSAEPIR